MRRNDIFFDEDEDLFTGEAGLWGAVLLTILRDLTGPTYTHEYRRAQEIVNKPETGCLPIVAAALDIEVVDLQKKIRQRSAILTHRSGKIS